MKKNKIFRIIVEGESFFFKTNLKKEKLDNIIQKYNILYYENKCDDFISFINENFKKYFILMNLETIILE